MFLMEFIVPNIEKKLKVKSDKKAFHLLFNSNSNTFDL